MVIRNRSTIKKKLGDTLVEVGVITQEQLNEVLAIQETQGGRMGALLIEKGYCSEDVLLAFLGRQCGVAYVSLAEYSFIPPEVIAMVPENVARLQNLIPLSKEDNQLTIAMSDPLNVFAIDDLKLSTGCDITVVISSQQEIKGAIDKFYFTSATSAGNGAAPARPPAAKPPSPAPPAVKPTYAPPEAPRIPEPEDPQNAFSFQDQNPSSYNPRAPKKAEQAHDSMEDILHSLTNGDMQMDAEAPTKSDVLTLSTEAGAAPVVKMVNAMINHAIKQRASDIHIEPFEKILKVRYRMDGVLQNQAAPPKKYHNAVISRIKVMAQLDIAERRLPQDGRIKLRIDGREVALRVSIIPTPFGEKAVLRILDSSGLNANLDQLGFEPETLETFKDIINSPHGIVLVTGPTGSGKSTTLYSTLAILNTPDTNIVTIEDPVEYFLEGVNQVQAKPDIGLTFASGLRSFLRQDPDIILVGEIRDTETAEISINAALTGHLVFSTLHTNDAPGAITRLTNMGIEPFLTCSTVIAVIAQRLMRKVCDQCKVQEMISSDLLTRYGVRPELIKGAQMPVFKGKGCFVCSSTGYKGRLAIYELLKMTDPIREMILERASNIRIKDAARKSGMITLREEALGKMLAGKTTLEEVLRVTQIDESNAA